MWYRIEYADGKYSTVHSRTDLLNRLNVRQERKITDIRKLYKSGVSDSVLEKYQGYIRTA